MFAEPQGGFGAQESLAPQRVQEPDGSWVPLDTTLTVASDGLVEPKATLAGLTLSDGSQSDAGQSGGDRPADISDDSLLYSLTSGDDVLSLLAVRADCRCRR